MATLDILAQSRRQVLAALRTAPRRIGREYALSSQHGHAQNINIGIFLSTVSEVHSFGSAMKLGMHATREGVDRDRAPQRIRRTPYTIRPRAGWPPPL